MNEKTLAKLLSPQTPLVHRLLYSSLIILISALSGWRWLAIIEGAAWSWGKWLGLTLGLVLAWWGGVWTIRRLLTPPSARRLFALIGAILCGLSGLLLTKPAGFATMTLELQAENVWNPTLFQAVWTANEAAPTPLTLPTYPAQTGTLQITATGRHHIPGVSGQAVVVGAMFADGRPLPLEDFKMETGWQTKAINWGTLQNQSTLAFAGNPAPARLSWTGPTTSPITLLFARNKFSGEVVIAWNSKVLKTFDLYDVDIGIEAVTLPLTGPVVWQAELPLTALAEELRLITHLDPLHGFEATLKEIRLVGVPGQVLGATGHALADRMYVEDGWAELVPDGIKVNPTTLDKAPQLFLTGFSSPWAEVLPGLENLLSLVYAAALGGLIFVIMGRFIRPAWLMNLNLSLITLLVTGLGGEIGLRWFLPSADHYYIWQPNLHFIFHPRLEIVTGVSGESNVRINAQGLRADELSPTANYYKILAIGGSTTESLYLDQTETWTQHLQNALNKSPQVLDFQVWVGNAGRSGRNSREHVVQVKHLLAQQPDLDALLLLVGVNDLGLRLEQGENYTSDYLNSPGASQRLMRRAFDIFPAQTPDIQPYYQQSTIWQLVSQFQQPQAQAATTEKIEVQDDDGFFLLERQNQRRNAEIRDQLPDLSDSLAEYRRNLNHMIDLAKAQGVRVILITQPSLWRPDLSEVERNRLWFGWGPGFAYFYSVEALEAGLVAYNEQLLTICRERQVECIDLAAALPKDMTVFYDDVHFNEQGSVQVSEVLADYLLTQPPFK